MCPWPAEATRTYRNMGLHRMPYGSMGDHVGGVGAGSLELLGQRRVIGRSGELELSEQDVGSERLHMAQDDPTLEGPVEDVSGARVVIMNPPFTDRKKMGEKFSEGIRKRLRERVDGLERRLVQIDPELDGFVSKTSIGPLFEALAEKCAATVGRVVAMVRPSIVFTGPASMHMRRVFARRFHIHTLLTCHQPGDVNLSRLHSTRRCDGTDPVPIPPQQELPPLRDGADRTGVGIPPLIGPIVRVEAPARCRSVSSHSPA